MLRLIRTEKQYETALAKAYKLVQLDLRVGSAEADELESLTMLIERYEAKHYPIPPPSMHPLAM